MRWIRKKHRYPAGDDMSVEVMEPRLLLSADALGIDAGVLDGNAQADDWDLISASAWWGFDAIDSGVDSRGNPAVEHAWADRQQPPELSTLNSDSAQQAVEQDNLDSLITVPSIDAEQIRYREIIFLDAGVADGEQLLTDLMGGADADLFQVYLIDSTSDGVAQMTTILNGMQGLDAIHIISHGAAGQIQLGSSTLANESLDDYAGQLSEWGSSLSESGDILIYGCDLAADIQGKALVDAISVATGADVAASTDQTGNPQSGGDWDLEYRPGAIETAAFAMTGTEAWTGALALVNVTTFNDLADGGDTSSIANLIATPGTDGISLREAIIASNNDSGVADTIALSAGTYTLAIAGSGEDDAATGDLDILDPLTITGAGASQTIIDGDDLDRVFHVIASSAFDVTISDLKIQNGFVDRLGGGLRIENSSAVPVVTLSNVWFSGNDTTGIFDSGGAIYNDGDLTIVDSLIEGNSAQDGGGVMNIFGGVLSMTNVTLSDNEATGGDGGGLFNASTATLLNVTVSGNQAASEGGGLHNYNLGGAVTKINNTLVADNSASSNPDVDGAFVSTTGDNLIEVVGTSTGLHGSDIKGIDPDIGVLSDNGGDTFTHALLIGSAAINAGSTPGAPTVDQRGYTRVGAMDIGAYEFAAGPIIVDTTADTVDGNTTSVWTLFDNKGADGFISLREAILAVNAGAGGDTISLGAGTYTFTAGADYEDLAVSGDLDITKDVTIIGAGAATTIIDAADIDRVFDVHNGTVMIQDLTMLDGDAGAENGGGIRIFNGATTDLVSVDIISNMAVSGGGIHSAGSLTLTDVTVDDNDATWGGGISIDDGSVTLDRVTISNNTSSNNGGGFYNFGVAASLANVTISGNSSSSNSGGGLWTNQAITATNVTIAHNSSNAGGAGIHAQGGGNVTLTNSILHNPSGLNANNSLISGGNNIDSDSSAGLGDPLDGFDPMLGTLADNAGPTQTHALLTGSVAIDNGTTAGAPVFDQRGVERDAAPDIGAYELGTPMATAFWTQDALLTPQFSSWDGTGFSVEANSASVGSYRFITGAESPTRDEMIVVGVDEISGAITGEIWTAPVGLHFHLLWTRLRMTSGVDLISPTKQQVVMECWFGIMVLTSPFESGTDPYGAMRQ